MKEIKDYLHLYLGCEVEFGYNGHKKKGRLTGKVEAYGWEVFAYSKGFDLYHKVRDELIKPILRPLSDMTDKEATEGKMWALWHDVRYMGEEWETATFTPQQFRWLLLKHFDLFGLIEAGLAIDKTMKDIENNWDDYCTAAAE